MADIRDLEKFAQGRWEWDRYGYSRAFAGGISPTDVDAMVERNGHFLFVEQKQYTPDNVGPYYLPKGQRIALERLAKLPQFMVLYVAGDAVDCSPWWVKNLTTDRVYDWREMPDPDVRRGLLIELFSAWWTLADTLPMYRSAS